MYLKKKPKYPIRKWLGKYSAHMASLQNTKTWESHESAIERFLKCFPRYRSLEHFSSTDFADYCILNPSAWTDPVHHFWEWLKSQGLPVYQIAILRYRAKKKTVNNLNFDDMLRLLACCQTTELKRKIIGAVKGESSFIPAHKVALRQELRDAATSAGLPIDFSLQQLKARINKRLRQGLIEHYCQQLLDTLPVETKLPSDTLATVQFSPLNERSTVTNCNYHLPPGCEIVQQYLGAKR